MNSLKNVNSQDVDYILDYVKVLEAASSSLFGAFFEVVTLFKSQVEQGNLGAKLAGGDEISTVWLVADEDIAAEILADFAKTNVENAKTALKTEQSDFENFDFEEYMLASLLGSNFASDSVESRGSGGEVGGFGGGAVANDKGFDVVLPEFESFATKTPNVGFSWDIPSEFDVLVGLMQGIYGINDGYSGVTAKNGDLQNENNFSNSSFGNSSTVFDNFNQSGSNFGQLSSNFSDEKISKTQSIEDFANEIAGIFSSGLAASRQSLAHKVQK